MKKYGKQAFPLIKFGIGIAALAFVLGIVASSTFLKQPQSSYPNVPANQTSLPTNQSTAKPTTTLPPVYDLKVSIAVSNPTLGRGETVLFSGQVTDLSFNTISLAQVNANLLDFTGSLLSGKTFFVYPNGTYFGNLDIPTNLTALGTYNISIQANFTNRFSQPIYTQVYVVR